MAISDEQFREAFKPLHIPSSYDPSDTKENKVVYALAQLGEATSSEVTDKMLELEPGYITDDTMITVGDILEGLYAKGLLKGTREDGDITYNLSKITRANDGEVNPELLAPGLD